jgi:REP element-mobilizing transposase RayT
VQFTGIQARAVARGFAASATRGRVRVWACSILPEHVHLVIGRHTSKVEFIVNCFKGDATKQLLEEGIHPFMEHRSADGKVPRCFAQREWKVFLDSPEDILRAIQYVEENPVKEGKRRQSWQFVRPYDPLV